MDSNLTQDFFDRIGTAYESAYAHDTGLLEFIQAAIQELPANATVLDVGCGTGKPVASTLANHGFNVFGIDRSKVMVDLCRIQVPSASFELADMLTYAPRLQFDAIFAIFCTFALSRQQTADLLAKFSQWLRPGGKVYLGTIAADDYPTQPFNYDSDGLYASGMDNEFMGEVVKISLLSKRGWQVFLENEGFRIDKTATKDFTPPEDAGCGTERHYFIAARKL